MECKLICTDDVCVQTVCVSMPNKRLTCPTYALHAQHTRAPMYACHAQRFVRLPCPTLRTPNSFNTFNTFNVIHTTSKDDPAEDIEAALGLSNRATALLKGVGWE